MRIVSFFTHSPSTVLKGTEYTNFKYGETESYLNPPALIPEANFKSSEKYLVKQEIDPIIFCEKFGCSSLEIGHLIAINAFIKMMKDPQASREFITSMICDKEGSFLKSLGIVQFNENTKTEFFKNAGGYFEDSSFIEDIVRMDEMDIE
jgi:hypothetical protein